MVESTTVLKGKRKGEYTRIHCKLSILDITFLTLLVCFIYGALYEHYKEEGGPNQRWFERIPTLLTEFQKRMLDSNFTRPEGETKGDTVVNWPSSTDSISGSPLELLIFGWLGTQLRKEGLHL